jgi:tRNA(Ile)-lysidine synthase
VSVAGFALHVGVLRPRAGNQEQRRQEEAEEDVDPDKADVVAAHTEASHEGAERAAKCVFHVEAPNQDRVNSYVADYVSGVPTQSEAVEGAVASMPTGRWLLAVSGGRDSMALLRAMSALRTSEIAAVATFDHGTGTAATRAADLVEATALRLSLPIMRGAQNAGERADEASWRAERWRFFRAWAAELNATIVTAHTRDDQVETVLLRLLRDTGARGLAGMLAPTRDGIARPLLSVSRADLAAYAEVEGVEFVHDPSNESMAFARNRARHELLPALERASPGFSQWCWDIGARAAALRADLAAWVDAELSPIAASPQSVAVRAAPLAALAPSEAAVIWPEVAARAGVTMDRRGIARVLAWAAGARVGSEVQLAGGAEIARTDSTFVVRRLYSYR